MCFLILVLPLNPVCSVLFFISFLCFFYVKNKAKRLNGYQFISIFITRVNAQTHSNTFKRISNGNALFANATWCTFRIITNNYNVIGVLVKGGQIARISLLCRFVSAKWMKQMDQRDLFFVCSLCLLVRLSARSECVSSQQSTNNVNFLSLL